MKTHQLHCTLIHGIRKFQLWICVLVITTGLHAQSMSDLKFELIDEAQGLSNSWISDLAVDSSGFVWIGTLGGLNRFDGDQFKVFRKNGASDGLLHDYGQRIYVAPDGRIWISYREGGFSEYNPATQSFRHFVFPENNVLHRPDRDFGVKYVGKDGRVWYSGDGMGLRSFQPITGQKQHWDLPDISEKFSETDGNEFNTVYSIYEDERGVFWLCTQNGLYEFHPGTGRFSLKKYNDSQPFSKRRDMFNKLVPEGDKGFWVGAWDGGISYFDRASETFTNYLFEKQKYGFYNLVYDLVPKNEHELWVVSGDRGLGVFDKRSGRALFERNLIDRERRDIVFLNRMLVLKSGVLLVADENALLRYNPYAHIFRFTRLHLENSQHGDLFHIRKILENEERNELYIATDLGGGLVVKNTKTGKRKVIPVDFRSGKEPKLRILDMHRDSDGRFWLLSRDYLYEYIPASGKLLRSADPFEGMTATAPEFVSIHPDGNGKFLILCNDGGLSEFDPGTVRWSRPVYVRDETKKQLKIGHICFDSRGVLWAWAPGKLTLRRPGNQSFLFCRDTHLLTSLKGKVRSLAAGKDGEVWVAVYDIGVLQLRMKPDGSITFRKFGQADGLVALKFTHMDTDPAGDPWLAGFMGVLRFDRKSGLFRHYSTTSGLDKYTISMRFFNSNSGAFYISSPGHYCRVDLKNLENYHPPARVYIDRIHIYNNGRNIPVGGQAVVLRPGEDYFSVDFGCLAHSSQNGIRYSYKLEGWDNDWIDAGKRRSAVYTSLRAGNYRFLVRMSLPEGGWSEPVALQMAIDTWFYRKTWFSVLMVVVFAGIVFSLYLYRIRRVRAIERVRADYQREITEWRMEALRAQMNPHFIFNSLNSINRYIIKNDPKTSSLYLTRFAKLMRLVLDNSRHKTISLATELEALKLYIELEAFRFESKFEYRIQIQDGLNTENIEIPPLIVQPYVENAIWHGLLHRDSPGLLEVSVSRKAGVLIIEISDNGVGRDKAARIEGPQRKGKRSVGMKLTGERIAARNEESGHSDVEIVDLYHPDGSPAGTRVIIQIQL